MCVCCLERGATVNYTFYKRAASMKRVYMTRKVYIYIVSVWVFFDFIYFFIICYMGRDRVHLEIFLSNSRIEVSFVPSILSSKSMIIMFSCFVDFVWDESDLGFCFTLFLYYLFMNFFVDY